MYCARHPQLDATQECARCGALHCADCVRWVGGERRRIAACTHCDGVLRPLNVRLVAPAREEAADSLGRLFTPTGLVTTAVIGVLTALSDIPVPIFDLLVGLVGMLALAATYFDVVDHVGRGKSGFPAPVEADGWPFATLVMRGALCLLVVGTPFGIWFASARGAEDLGELARAHPFTAILLGLAALVWLTAGLLAMLVTVSGLAAFWPPALVRVVALDPQRYVRLLGLMVATTAALVLLRLLVHLAAGHVLFLSTFLLTATSTLGALAQATLVGAFVHRHRETYTTR